MVAGPRAPRLGIILPRRSRIIIRIGAQDIVYYNMDVMPTKAEDLIAAKRRTERFGLRLSVVEGGPPMDKIILGETRELLSLAKLLRPCTTLS